LYNFLIRFFMLE